MNTKFLVGLSVPLFALTSAISVVGCAHPSGTKEASKHPVPSVRALLSENMQIFWPISAVEMRVKNSSVTSKVVELTRSAVNGSEQHIVTLIHYAALSKASGSDIEQGTRADYIIYVMLSVGDERFASALNASALPPRSAVRTEVLSDLEKLGLSQHFPASITVLRQSS